GRERGDREVGGAAPARGLLAAAERAARLALLHVTLAARADDHAPHLRASILARLWNVDPGMRGARGEPALPSRPGCSMRRVALVLLLLVAGCSHFSIGPASESFEPAHYAPGELSMQGALAVARVAGTPDEIGAQLGALAGRPAAELLSSFEFAEHFRSLVAPECAPLDELVRSVPESHRRELEALAHIAGVDS